MTEAGRQVAIVRVQVHFHHALQMTLHGVWRVLSWRCRRPLRLASRRSSINGYGWADLYSAQLHSGEDYGTLRPNYAIWLLAENLLRDDKDYAHCYRLRDERGRVFLDHGGI